MSDKPKVLLEQFVAPDAHELAASIENHLALGHEMLSHKVFAVAQTSAISITHFFIWIDES